MILLNVEHFNKFRKTLSLELSTPVQIYVFINVDFCFVLLYLNLILFFNRIVLIVLIKTTIFYNEKSTFSSNDDIIVSVLTWSDTLWNHHNEKIRKYNFYIYTSY